MLVQPRIGTSQNHKEIVRDLLLQARLALDGIPGTFVCSQCLTTLVKFKDDSYDKIVNTVVDDLIVYYKLQHTHTGVILDIPVMVCEVLEPDESFDSFSAQVEMYQSFGVKEIWGFNFTESVAYHNCLNKPVEVYRFTDTLKTVEFPTLQFNMRKFAITAE